MSDDELLDERLIYIVSHWGNFSLSRRFLLFALAMYWAHKADVDDAIHACVALLAFVLTLSFF